MKSSDFFSITEYFLNERIIQNNMLKTLYIFLKIIAHYHLLVKALINNINFSQNNIRKIIWKLLMKYHRITTENIYPLTINYGGGNRDYSYDLKYYNKL